VVARYACMVGRKPKKWFSPDVEECG